MSSQLTRKQIISTVASLVILVVVLYFTLFSGGSNDEQSSGSETQSTLPGLVNDNATNQRYSQELLDNLTTTTQRLGSPIQPQAFDRNAQSAYLTLPTTGELDPNNIGNYTTPRYEAIMGGDPSSPIPISELNNPSNSDLTPELFTLARTTAIEVTSAEITGKGTEKWPLYFAEEPKGRCYNFRSTNTGATSLPLASSKNWIITYVYYSAICPSPSGPVNVSQLVNVYFENIGGRLNPKTLSEVPRS